MFKLSIQLVLEKDPYDSQNRKIDKYYVQICLEIVEDNTTYTAGDDRTGDDERSYHQVVFEFHILILHKVNRMHPCYLKRDPLDRKYTEDNVCKDDDGSAKHHITRYLDNVQEDREEIDMIDAYVLKKRLNEAVECSYEHKDADHIYGKIGTFKLCYKGQDSPVYVGYNEEYQRLDPYKSALFYLDKNTRIIF